MSKNTKNTSGQGTPVVEGLAKLEAQKTALKAEAKVLKTAAKLAEWEKAKKAKNPAFVLGSTRKATEADEAILGHTHGQVCEISCQAEECSTIRVINKQDAFQVRFCQAHKKEAQRTAGKVRREAKKTAARTPAVLKAEIAVAKKELAEMQKAIAAAS